MTPDDCSRWPQQCAEIMTRGASLRGQVLTFAVIVAAIVGLSITRRAAVYSNRRAVTLGLSGRAAGLAVYAGALGILLLGLIVRG